MKPKRYKSKNKTNFRIFLLFCFSIIGLTVGYSALNEEIKITGEAFVRPVRDVRITDVRLSETANEGLNSYNNFNINSINVGASLPKINSTVTYEVDISNIGDVPVIVKSITPDYGNNSNIEYVIDEIEVGKTIIGTNANNMGKPTTIKVTVKYKSGVTTIPTDPNASLKLTFEFEVAVDSILAASSSNISVFNNSNITCDKIETIKFKGTIDIPENIPDSNIWDASLNKDNSVIAYYTVNNDTGLYNVVIGGYGKIQFPPNSSYLFKKYKNLEKIDFGDYIDTSNVTNMYNMFYGCSSLANLDLSNFNTSNVTSMSHMFSECSGLTNLDLSSFNTSKVTNMSSMFSECSSLANLDLSSFNTSKVTNMSSMFSECSSLANLDLSNFNTSKVTNMSGMFSGGLYGSSALKKLDLTNFDTSNVTNISMMFENCTSLEEIKGIENFDTSKVTTMVYGSRGLFKNCKNLKSLDLSKWIITSNVTTMNYMFYGCSSLANLDLSSFNTSKVTDMSSMFSECSSLTSLDLSNFNTSNVTAMYNMFSECSSLTSLDLSNFNTLNVTSMSYMFIRCSSLTNLDLSSFDTSNVTNMHNMFYGCSGLTSLNIKNFTFNKTSYNDILYMVPSSTIIFVRDQTAYDFINSKRAGGCTAGTCPVCSNTSVTCP